MVSNLGVRCCIAVFLLCAVGLQSSGAAKEKGIQSQTTRPRPMREDRLTVEAGWIVIQQRTDGSEDFNRGWQEYVDGFGILTESSDFWWGLEWVHQLTDGGKYELMIEIIDNRGGYLYARYSEFVVGGENEKYKLKKLGGYSGTAGDIKTLKSDLVPTGMPFSTHDNYNGPGRGNCASSFKGGWWWNNCGAGLNSQWGKDAMWQANNKKPVKYTRMLIRPRK